MAYPIYVQSGTKTAGVGTVTPAAPASAWQVDDILIVTAQYDEATIGALNTANGFAEMTGSPSTTTGQGLSVYWKRATSTADTMPTVADPGDHVGTQCHVFRGCKVVDNPWNVTDAWNEAASDTSWASDGVTTTASECLIVEIASNPFDTATAQSSAQANGNLTAVAEVMDSWMSTGNGGGFVLVTGQKALPGATGSTTGTFANAAVKSGLTIALEPQPVFPPPAHILQATERASIW